MVLCIVAMVVFGILGIFSVGYRRLAFEAFQCVFRMITLRPCESNFDQKMKAKIVGKLMFVPTVARAINNHFKIISWIFVIMFFASLGYSAYAVYNLAVYKTCDPQHPENCVFTPLINGSEDSGPVCQIDNNFIEFYGRECPHCIKMMTVVQATENRTGVSFEKLEVWYNSTNQLKMKSFESNIKKACGVFGVPTFYSQKTGKAICGEVTEQQLESFIKENG